MITKDEVLLYMRRIEELEEKEPWLNETNVHFAQKAREAEDKSGVVEDQGRKLFVTYQAVLKESNARLERVRE